jgi:hypothetical protein
VRDARTEIIVRERALVQSEASELDARLREVAQIAQGGPGTACAVSTCFCPSQGGVWSVSSVPRPKALGKPSTPCSPQFSAILSSY